MRRLILVSSPSVVSPASHACPVVKQVFGVLDSPEYSGSTTGGYRPVIHQGTEESLNLPADGSSVDLLHGFIPAAVSAPPTGPMQVTQAQQTLRCMMLSMCMSSGVQPLFPGLPFPLCLVSAVSCYPDMLMFLITICVLGSRSNG